MGESRTRPLLAILYNVMTSLSTKKMYFAQKGENFFCLGDLKGISKEKD